MRLGWIPLVLLAAACQSESRRLLLVDLTLADPLTLETTAAPWDAAGYRVEYRQFYPHLTRSDLDRYRTIIVLGGREPEGRSDALTIGDLAILNEWTRRDGVVVLGYTEGGLDRWVMNQWLGAQGAGIAIAAEQLEARAEPLPHSALDNAGFAPFPAGWSHALQVRDRSQTLARGPSSALVAASRVGDGLIVVVSRSLLASGNEDPRARDFLDALATWTRRPAEWASVRTGGDARPQPLRLAGAPQAVTVHPPPLRPPAGAAAVVLPQPLSANRADTVVPSGWIARQGMRVLWSSFTPQSLDSLLRFVDVAALNALATVIPVPALADTIGTRNIWRVTGERLQATSIRWFPAVALVAIPSEGADEVNRHGDLTPIACGLDSMFWRGALRPLYRTLTRLGGARPDVIAGVALDLDSAMTLYQGSGLCDADLRVGLASMKWNREEIERLVALPPTLRYDTLLERGLLKRYFAGLEVAVAERAITLRAELRRLHPDVRFAFHASTVPSDWFSLGLLRGFSTHESPALLWIREPRGRAVLRHYRERDIYALSAFGLQPKGDLPRLRSTVFGEHTGFWLDGAATDSLGRVIRRFAK